MNNRKRQADSTHLRIVQLIQKPQLRGAEIFACQLSSHLLASGHEVLIISLFPGEAALPFEGKIIAMNRPVARRLFDVPGWRRLANEIRDFDPELVQANAGDTLKFAVFSKLFYGWRAEIIFRNANKVSDFARTWGKRVFNKFLVGSTKHVISVSELCRQDIVATYKLSDSKTTTVPIGVEELPVDLQVPLDLKSTFAEGRVLVHVASFVAEKNHEGLLRITRKLIDAGERVTLLLIGDGPLRHRVEKQIVELKLENSVRLLGFRKDVLHIISSAACLVLPSRIEGLPAVILEAMLCKTPVVSYDVGGISEVIKTGETGWLVKAGDETAFVSAVRETLQGNTERILGNALTLVKEEYSNRRIAGRFMEVYNRVGAEK